MLDPTIPQPKADGASSALSALGSGLNSHLIASVCAILGVIAFVAVVNAFFARRKASAASHLARIRSQRMSELLRTVRMAESIAELGVWQFEPATGQQHWSKGMRAIFGVHDDEPFVEGDAETLLYANDVDLVSSVLIHRDEAETFELRFDIVDREGNPRAISVQACNLRNASGGVARVIAVIRDVTDQVAHERDLELSRELALSEAEHARELAATDALTGLANRRRVMAELDQMLVRARRTGGQLSLIVFDLDHFKSINDTFGHPEGDKVLRKVAKIAMAQARGSDLVGRVGGEEFVWLVPGIGEHAAHALADRLRRAVALHSGAGAIPGVTTSVGCAEMRPADTSLSLFSRADNALYAAKDAGRNQVRMAA